MFVNKIRLTHFKGFERLEVNFNKRCTLIVGNHGSGKSSLLDGIATGMAAYLTGFNHVRGPSINKADAYLKTVTLGQIYDVQKQFPVSIDMCAIINESEVSWNRNLKGPNNKTTLASAFEIRNVARTFQSDVSHGNTDIILPLVAYYGTDRGHSMKRLRHGKTTQALSDRTRGYADSLNATLSTQAMYTWILEMDRIEYEEKQALHHYRAVLNCIKTALESVLGEGNVYTVSYSPKVKDLVVEYRGEEDAIITCPLRHFSDSIKHIAYLIGDIAVRMAMLNPQLEHDIALGTPGIVLIDDIEMDLHPKCQATLVKRLMDQFPNIQFILSTHSPSVLTNLDDAVAVYCLDTHTLEGSHAKS